MSELAELKLSIEKLDKKTDRLLSWAEGDTKLGRPSIAQQIRESQDEIVETHKRTESNEQAIRDLIHAIDNHDEKIVINSEAIKESNRRSSIFGAGAGGILFTLIEAIKHFFTSL